jgi:hypothetical protein
MECIADDIKGTMNKFMAEQQKESGKTVFDVFQFSDETKRIVERADMADYQGGLMDSYVCGGLTALNDAVCIAIDTLGKEFAAMPEEERPGQVVFAIVTDGHENASKEYDLKDVKTRIDRQSGEYSWEFVYLAANQDEFEAREISQSMGVHASISAPCMNDLGETTRRTLSRTMTNVRMSRVAKKDQGGKGR